MQSEILPAFIGNVLEYVHSSLLQIITRVNRPDLCLKHLGGKSLKICIVTKGEQKLVLVGHTLSGLLSLVLFYY